MNLILLTTVCALCVLQVSAAKSASYHCLRPGHDCTAPDTCDAAAGQCGSCTPDTADPPVYTCTCAATAKGENCAITTAISGAACTDTPPPACSPTGSYGCYKDDGADDKCYCKEDYYDTLCDKKRIDAVCTAVNIALTIVPYTDAAIAGAMYVEGTTVDDCKLDGAAAGTSHAYTKTIVTTTAPGGTCDIKTPELKDDPDDVTKVTGTQKCVNVIVQHNAEYVSSTDLKVTACCAIYNDQTNVVMLPIGTATVTNKYKAHPVTKAETGVTMTFQKDSVDVISTTVVLMGDVLTITLTLDSTKAGFNDILLIAAKFSGTTDFATPIEVVKLGCVQKVHKSVVKTLTQHTDTRAITFEFRGFKIIDAANVNVQITYRVCSTKPCTPAPPCDTDADVKPETDNIKFVGRRKRQIDQDKIDIFNMSFGVADPNGIIRSSGNPVIQQQSCLTNVAFLLPLVILVVICLMSMAAAMFFCLKLNQRNRNDPERYNGVTGPYKE